MKTTLLALISALATPVLVGASPDCPTPVRVDALDSRGRIIETGSGFVVRRGRGVITAAHVVEHAHTIRIETPDGTQRWARAVDRNNRHDVALIQLRGRALPEATTVRPGRPLPGGTVETIGHVPALGFVTIQNRVRATAVPTVMGSVIETEAPWVAGISGAALVGRNCRVVGMASFGRVDPMPHYYAIPSELFSQWLADD